MWCLNKKKLCSFLTSFGFNKMMSEKGNAWEQLTCLDDLRNIWKFSNSNSTNFEANVPKGSEVTTCSESSSCFLFLMCILNFFYIFCRLIHQRKATLGIISICNTINILKVSLIITYRIIISYKDIWLYKLQDIRWSVQWNLLFHTSE